MAKLLIPQPVSGGLLLSYKCNSECKHCMYGCSPRWKADWIRIDDAEKVLTQLSKAFKKNYHGGYSLLGVNLGLHFTGGEPFLNFKLLLDLVKRAHMIGFPSTFVETNCFWSVNNEVTEQKLSQLKEAGLNGILVSVNPFILEYVPFERTLRTLRVSEKVFEGNVIVYQEFFRRQFENLRIKGTLSFEEYLGKVGIQSLRYVELIPMGRACYRLRHLYKKHPADAFFGESCTEELTRPWHIHIDNYCNYMAGYCGGISLGDARNLDSRCQGIELNDHPVIAKLVSSRGIGKLFQFSVEEYGYKALEDGYVSKCHLCIDMRKNIVERTNEFKELKPREFYSNLQ
jgi:MoaA/NifB/PqqE/SkfB family radical SAM enzyme